MNKKEIHKKYCDNCLKFQLGVCGGAQYHIEQNPDGWQDMTPFERFLKRNQVIPLSVKKLRQSV